MTERARSYSWEDPTDLARSGTQMSGLEYLRAMQAGDLPHPPICATVGFRFVGFDEGRAVMELEPGEHQYNTIGTVHGGVIVTLLDSVAGSAVHTTLPAKCADDRPAGVDHVCISSCMSRRVEVN
jgi:acyl-coenzyme A thioesterase PaaI-like protein